MIYNDPMLWPKENVPVGTVWTITEDGDWEAPATGNYQVKLHGGGGGAACSSGAYVSTSPACAGGGGSGEIYAATFEKGQTISAKIGLGGAGRQSDDYGSYVAGGTGGTTTFGQLSLPGGGGGTAYSYAGTVAGGKASGSIATDGEASGVSQYRAGGYGNTAEPTQTFGNGGSMTTSPQNGQPGAVIITYLGKG